ncbi:hypothetical protein Bca52824_055559 [Brassica carinata]|uniref:Uncharacterized protein n=1 Tax=Brassica carinata TaxID=52824 RepID=A0A8X7UMX3_BRACI|nr:hypothetical protein Bca52824_055559 [Brassica carinata]
MLAQERSVLQAMIDNNTRQSLKAMSISQETAVSTDMNTDTSSDFEYEPVYVPCFSNQTDQARGNTLNGFSNSVLNSIQADIFQRIPLYQSPMLAQERSVLQAMIDNNTRQSLKAMSISQETAVSTDMNTDTSSDFEYGKRRLNAQEDPSSSIGLVDLEPFWNY